ncbi:ferrochelatase [Entomomonas asaccharolytica]|uniref:Ferrochelatase n=1 Tax=Entomomonas asaccharolytica TaxID=2785331 RepID=A0A974NDT1_9GAMM|nr:ferrochelatase [Entomomonas asaccharolytica]QQP84775.1 ferrochelatase [Entomomonas asaccharolytica]
MSNHALLLMNLGSPKSPKTEDVKPYLKQFLMDPYVVDLPWPIRKLLVSMILIKRPEASAHAYQSIWWSEGSPLVVLSKRLQKMMELHWQHGPVALAMRYGEPSIESVLLGLKKQGVEQVTLAPLYPQFAESTVTTALEEVKRVVKGHGLSFKFKLLAPFYNQPRYLNALVSSAQEVMQQDFDHLLFSFHGVPERHIHKLVKDSQHNLQATHSSQIDQKHIDVCYRTQCLKTAELFAERVGLPDDKWSVSFQSRLGRTKWIEPYTDRHLDELAAKGVKRLLVMSPAFVADCLETLEEIGIRGREQFLAAGGSSFELIPCLNDTPSWVVALNQLCQPEETKPFMIN